MIISTRTGRSGAARIFRAAALAAMLTGASAANAAVIWNLPAGGSWNTAANWNPQTVPNAVGEGATFNNAATASNPAQTGNRSVTLDGAQTVGSIVFNNDAANAFTNSIALGTAGSSLTFDEVDAGPGTINVPAAAGTGNNTISAPMVLNDNLVANVDQTTASSAAGALNLTGAMSGAGGFTKNGPGLATFGTGGKTYTGPTVINGGRIRISSAAHPTANSSFTINAGGQVELITGGTFNFGGNPVNLNGAGATSGFFAQFPGAIRPARATANNITAPIVLQTDTLLHMQATAGIGAGATPSNGNITIQGVISGPGKLTFTAPNSDADQGHLIISRNNTYTGGTLVAGGQLQVTGALAKLGTGDVTVDNASSPLSIARLALALDTTDAIDDAATLILAGGGAPGVADQNYASLGDGINEIVGGLILGGVAQPDGTYGATGSGATFINDEYFTGTGIISVAVPEPASLSLLGIAAAACIRRRARPRN
jgi:autotransporter-associated beta strand protein